MLSLLCVTRMLTRLSTSSHYWRRPTICVDSVEMCDDRVSSCPRANSVSQLVFGPLSIAAVLSAEHPRTLLELNDYRVEEVRRRGIFRIHFVMDVTDGSRNSPQASGDQIDNCRRVELAGGQRFQSRGRCYGRRSPVWRGAEGSHAFCDRVARVACIVDNLIELQMQIAEVVTYEIPMSLLSL